jgi:signal transduction histidine kinase
VDSGQLQQVLLNLIANAADAMRATMDRARVLTVTSGKVDSRFACVSIEDTGTGIDPRDIDRVVEPFFTTKSNGMGLGLAICRSIVESYDGTVTVRPNAPHGSIFGINLPSSQIPD